MTALDEYTERLLNKQQQQQSNYAPPAVTGSTTPVAPPIRQSATPPPSLVQPTTTPPPTGPLMTSAGAPPVTPTPTTQPPTDGPFGPLPPGMSPIQKAVVGFAGVLTPKGRKLVGLGFARELLSLIPLKVLPELYDDKDYAEWFNKQYKSQKFQQTGTMPIVKPGKVPLSAALDIAISEIPEEDVGGPTGHMLATTLGGILGFAYPWRVSYKLMSMWHPGIKLFPKIKYAAGKADLASTKWPRMYKFLSNPRTHETYDAIRAAGALNLPRLALTEPEEPRMLPEDAGFGLKALSWVSARPAHWAASEMLTMAAFGFAGQLVSMVKKSRAASITKTGAGTYAIRTADELPEEVMRAMHAIEKSGFKDLHALTFTGQLDATQLAQYRNIYNKLVQNLDEDLSVLRFAMTHFAIDSKGKALSADTVTAISRILDNPHLSSTDKLEFYTNMIKGTGLETTTHSIVGEKWARIMQAAESGADKLKAEAQAGGTTPVASAPQGVKKITTATAVEGSTFDLGGLGDLAGTVESIVPLNVEVYKKAVANYVNKIDAEKFIRSISSLSVHDARALRNGTKRYALSGTGDMVYRRWSKTDLTQAVARTVKKAEGGITPTAPPVPGGGKPTIKIKKTKKHTGLEALAASRSEKLNVIYSGYTSTPEGAKYKWIINDEGPAKGRVFFTTSSSESVVSAEKAKAVAAKEWKEVSKVGSTDVTKPPVVSKLRKKSPIIVHKNAGVKKVEPPALKADVTYEKGTFKTFQASDADKHGMGLGTSADAEGEVSLNILTPGMIDRVKQAGGGKGLTKLQDTLKARIESIDKQIKKYGPESLTIKSKFAPAMTRSNRRDMLQDALDYMTGTQGGKEAVVKNLAKESIIKAKGGGAALINEKIAEKTELIKEGSANAKKTGSYKQYGKAVENAKQFVTTQLGKVAKGSSEEAHLLRFQTSLEKK